MLPFRVCQRCQGEHSGVVLARVGLYRVWCVCRDHIKARGDFTWRRSPLEKFHAVGHPTYLTEAEL